ncbi:hypothetical protein J2S42_001249 [Catenuloplanes indicus]|uniref:Uncharacterized protein n=1 Tax=Catenuloplanes indicus TaxID=137267 RepID=A0AAE3VVT2_9ACTN|nr:hypothetical protein [Catenuloplanes indicus]
MNFAALALSVEATKRSSRSALPDAPRRPERERRWWPFRKGRRRRT